MGEGGGGHGERVSERGGARWSRAQRREKAVGGRGLGWRGGAGTVAKARGTRTKVGEGTRKERRQVTKEGENAQREEGDEQRVNGKE